MNSFYVGGRRYEVSMQGVVKRTQLGDLGSPGAQCLNGCFGYLLAGPMSMYVASIRGVSSLVLTSFTSTALRVANLCLYEL